MALKQRRDLGLLVLRLAAGGLLLPHGWGKLTQLASGDLEFPDPLGIGGAPSLVLVVFAELVCALLVLVGFKTRLAALPPAFAMLVAALVFHAPDDLGTKELPLLYAAVYVALALLGGGRYSLDGWLDRRG